MTIHITQLPQRGILEIQGEDRASFLQGLITNDIHLVSSEHSIYACLLTPQGRYLYDFFIVEEEGSYLLETEASRLNDLLKKLNLYKLRSKVQLNLRSDLKVYAFWGEGVALGLDLREEMGHTTASFFMDPRLLSLGARAILSSEPSNFQSATPNDYDLHRLVLGVPEGGKDLIPEKSILLESGLDELNAISWTKGCYMGQELTARTKFRGLVRKRLLPVLIPEGSPKEGAEIFLNEQSVGEMRSHNNNHGLALLRLEAALEKEDLICGNARLKPYIPPWMVLEDPS